MKYKCTIHNSNEGYYDEEGKWHCWKCTTENKYYYPEGKVIDSFNIPEKNIEIRLVCIGDHSIKLEVWDTKDPKLVTYRDHPYLSTALRDFESEVRRRKYEPQTVPRRRENQRASLNLPPSPSNQISTIFRGGYLIETEGPRNSVLILQATFERIRNALREEFEGEYDAVLDDLEDFLSIAPSDVKIHYRRYYTAPTSFDIYINCTFTEEYHTLSTSFYECTMGPQRRRIHENLNPVKALGIIFNEIGVPGVYPIVQVRELVRRIRC